MASIATCPRCSSPLEVPATVEPSAQLECPVCEVEFALAAVRLRDLPQARIIERAVATEPAPAPESSAERLSRLLRSSSSWSPPAPPDVDAPEPADDVDEASEPIVAEEPSSSAAPGGTSRLDQLLSELMTSPAAAASGPLPRPTVADEITPAAPPADDEPAYEAGDAGYATTSYEDSAIGGQSLDGDEFEVGDDELAEADDDAVPSFDGAAGADVPVGLRTAPRRKRRPRVVRTLVGVVGGGVLGILLGAYGLIWIRGVEGDLLGIAPWIPDALLPESARSLARSEPDDDQASSSSAADALAARLRGAGTPPVDDGGAAAAPERNEAPADDAAEVADVRVDSSVVGASAAEPVDESATASAPAAEAQCS
jgi:hypothetical protein